MVSLNTIGHVLHSPPANIAGEAAVHARVPKFNLGEVAAKFSEHDKFEKRPEIIHGEPSPDEILPDEDHNLLEIEHKTPTKTPVSPFVNQNIPESERDQITDRINPIKSPFIINPFGRNSVPNRSN